MWLDTQNMMLVEGKEAFNLSCWYTTCITSKPIILYYDSLPGLGASDSDSSRHCKLWGGIKFELLNLSFVSDVRYLKRVVNMNKFTYKCKVLDARKQVRRCF